MLSKFIDTNKNIRITDNVLFLLKLQNLILSLIISFYAIVKMVRKVCSKEDEHRIERKEIGREIDG